MRKWSLPCLLFPLTMVITTATLLFQQLSKDTQITVLGGSHGRERREVPRDDVLPLISNVGLQDDAFMSDYSTSDDVEDEFEANELRLDENKLELETILIPFSSIASLVNPAKDRKDEGLMKTIEHGANFVNSLSTELARNEGNVGKATAQMNRRTLIDGLGFFMGSFEKLDGISFFEKLQEATIRFYSVPRNPDEIQAFSIRTQEALVTFSEYQYFFTDPQSAGYQSSRGRAGRERREVSYKSFPSRISNIFSNTAEGISESTRVGSSKIELRRKEESQLETIMIPFSNIASIGNPANSVNDAGLLKTIKNGANFVNSLRTNLAREEGNMRMEKATAQMNRRTLIDGLGFFMGSFEKLDSVSFYQKVQEETIRFYSVPRNPDEIQAFSVRTQEAIQTFSEYQHIFTTPQPAEEVNTRAESDDVGLGLHKSGQADYIPEERRIIQYLTTKEPILVSGPVGGKGLEDKSYSKSGNHFEDKSLNSHFQRIYRPHRIEEENDKLTLPRISVSTDHSLASAENKRTDRDRHLSSQRRVEELGLTEKLSVAGEDVSPDVGSVGSNRIDVLIEEEVMKDLEMKEDIIDTFLDRILVGFESSVVENNVHVGSEEVSKTEETLDLKKKLEHTFPKFKVKVAESSSTESILVEAFSKDVVRNNEKVNGDNTEKDATEMAFGHKLRHALLSNKSVMLMMKDDGLDAVAASPGDGLGGDASDHGIYQEDSVKRTRKLSTHRSGIPMIGKMLIVNTAVQREEEKDPVEGNLDVSTESSQVEDKYLDVFIDNILASLNLPSGEVSVSDKTYKLMVDSESKTHSVMELNKLGSHKEVMMIPSSMLDKSVKKEKLKKKTVILNDNALRLSSTPSPETRFILTHLSPPTVSSPPRPLSSQKISQVNKSGMLVKVYEQGNSENIHVSADVVNELGRNQPLVKANRGSVLKVALFHEDGDVDKEGPMVVDTDTESTGDSMEDFLDRLLNQINFESQKEVPEESKVFLKVKEANSNIDQQVSESHDFKAEDDSVGMSLDKLVVVDAEPALGGKRRVVGYLKNSPDSGAENLLPSLGTGMKNIMVMIKKDRDNSSLEETAMEEAEKDDTTDEDDNRLDVFMKNILDTHKFYSEVSVSDEKYAKMVYPLPSETTGATVHLRSRTALTGAEQQEPSSMEKPLRPFARHFSSMEVLMVPTNVFKTITGEAKANNIPIYRPRKKFNKNFKNFYKEGKMNKKEEGVATKKKDSSKVLNTSSFSSGPSALQRITTGRLFTGLGATFLNTTISSVETTETVSSVETVPESTTYSSEPTTMSSAGTTMGFPDTTLPSSESTASFLDVTLSLTDTTASYPDTTLSLIETTASYPDTTVSFIETTASNPDTTVSLIETTASNPDTIVSLIETTSSYPDTTLSLTETTLSYSDTLSPEETTASFPDITLSPSELTASFSDTKLSPEEIKASLPDTTFSPTETTASFPDTTLSLTETTASFSDITLSPTETTASFPGTTVSEVIETNPSETTSQVSAVTVSTAPIIIETTVSASELRNEDVATEYAGDIDIQDVTQLLNSDSDDSTSKVVNVGTNSFQIDLPSASPSSTPAKPRMSFVRHFSRSGFQFTRKPRLGKNPSSSVTLPTSASTQAASSTTGVSMSSAASIEAISTTPSTQSQSSIRLTTGSEFTFTTVSPSFRSMVEETSTISSKTIETTEYSSMSITTMVSEVAQTLTSTSPRRSIVDEATTVSGRSFETTEYFPSLSNVYSEVLPASRTFSTDVTLTTIKESDIIEAETTSTPATLDTSTETEEESEQVEHLITVPQSSKVEFSFIELLQPVKQEASSPVTAKSLIFTPIPAVPASLEISPFLSTAAVESVSLPKIDQLPVFTHIPAVPLPSPELAQSFKPIVAVPITSTTVSPAVSSSSTVLSTLPSGESTADVLALSLKLLKKLTMLVASDVDAEELPELLNSVYKPEKAQQLTRTEFTLPTSTSTPKPVLRKKNFKHKKFASFYKKLNDKESEEDTVDEEVEGEKVGLLASLRSQITANALKDKKLKAKANNIPIYRPRKKLNKKNVKNFYQERKMNKKQEGVAAIKKDSLKLELQETLKAQLDRLKSDIQTKLINEKVVKQKLEVELADSLRSQLAAVLPSLASTTPRPLDLMLNKMDDEQLRQSLEDQLRALYNT